MPAIVTVVAVFVSGGGAEVIVGGIAETGGLEATAIGDDSEPMIPRLRDKFPSNMAC